MVSFEKEPFFSVIIPSRNRADLFKRALKSVLNQSFTSYEVILVDDGSDSKSKLAYQDIISENTKAIKISIYSLVSRPNGNGPSYARNYGAQNASGQYLCFLDDDDEWSEDDHLLKAFSAINSYETSVDAFFSNQRAFYSNGTLAEKNIWIEDLNNKDVIRNATTDMPILVDVDFLLQSNGFAHLNCTIVNKDTYQLISGMDENIRYEEDRDFYLRLIDKSKHILYSPSFVAKHHIPNKKSNASQVCTEYEKLLYQLRIYEKGIIFSDKKSIHSFCVKFKQITIKKITKCLYEEKKIKHSFRYALQALVMGFSVKYFIFTMYLMLLSWFYIKK